MSISAIISEEVYYTMKQSIQGALVALSGLVVALLLMAWVVIYEYKPAHEMKASNSTSTGTGTGTSQPSGTQSAWAIPDKIASTGADMADAESFVKQTCIVCHGADLKGNIGPNLYQVSAKLSLSEIETVLKNGKQDPGKQMPAGLVSSDKIPEIAKFIKALSTTKL